tara:strand:+ start:204 stop:473 length:270 start_codon:yes stop_codon:yes gene_type:complete
MSSPFQQSFSAKSPLNNHKEVAKLLRQAKRENPQDKDYERIADLKIELSNAKEAHKKNNSKDQVNLPSTADEQQSIVNMNDESKKKLKA